MSHGIVKRFRIAAAASGVLPVAAVSVLAACASAGASLRSGVTGSRPLAAVIDSVVSTPPLAATSWGIAVQDAGTGEWLARLNADHHFVPASNTKVVVTMAAMELLGSSWTWQTPVFAEMFDDSTAGDVVIEAMGDPSFSARYHETDFTVTDSLAAGIAAAGIRRIRGDIVVNASRFSDASINGTWEVGDLPWSYAPPIDAFAIGEATFRLLLTGGAMRGDAVAFSNIEGPQGLQPLHLDVRTDTAGGRAAVDIDYLRRIDDVVVRGTVPAGHADTSRLAVTSPANFAARALEYALRTRGVRIDGGIRIVRDSVEAAALHARLATNSRQVALAASPPLGDVVAGILRPSQNWIAEQLLKTLGAEQRGRGSWDTGLDVERRWLIDRAGIDSTSFFLRDASGLSPQNLLSPATLVALFAYARRTAWADTYYEALPEPGMPESTLENRLLELKGRLRAKTGSITNVNTLSGYVTARSGRVFIFSIMTNGTGVASAAVRRGMDRIVTAIAEGADIP
jgi:serine-type D-Ala-D-Ala carboxypeptidase/endopeptidase (penicillin-binding protein 4)